MLRNQIKVQLHLGVGAAPSNFELTVPDGESELVQQMVKDPYNFQFLGSAKEQAVHAERLPFSELVGGIADPYIS